MLSDDAPRGFVHMRDYLRERREVEALREELVYAKWRLGEGAGDDERCVIAGSRLKLRRGDMRFFLRVVRASPMPVFCMADDHPDSTRVYACRIRKAIARDGGDPKIVQTIDTVGYMITRSGLLWAQGWVPELFRPLPDVMGEFQAANYQRIEGGSRGQQGSSGKQRRGRQQANGVANAGA